MHQNREKRLIFNFAKIVKIVSGQAKTAKNCKKPVQNCEKPAKNYEKTYFDLKKTFHN